MKNGAIFIVLILFLAITAFFWFQILRVRDLPPGNHPSPLAVSGADATAFIKLAQELLIDYREPMNNLYGRDPFLKNKSTEEIATKIDPTGKLVLSSIIYSDSNALAVVNGKILAEGDTIYDQEFGFEFMIENIETNKVEINDGDKKYTLKVAL